jgi:hypothetical protein
MRLNKPEEKSGSFVMLYMITQIDSSNTFFPEKMNTIIREELLKNINNNDIIVKLYSVKNMGHFGIKNDITILKNIIDTDKTKIGNTFIMKKAAEESINKLKSK